MNARPTARLARMLRRIEMRAREMGIAAIALGTVAVERASDGDRAWKLTEDGWVECDPPPRSATSRDGEAEMWYPEPRNTNPA